ncbi:MAG: trigger factor [Clostridia bacterium]|nr:trigger factor [Clostridia bacterium]
MKYTQSVGEKSTVKLLITFTEQEWQDAINTSYMKVRGKYSVPGFRKGKVPKVVLENYYGKGVFYEEAFNSLYNRYYPEILNKEKDNFTAVGEPELDVEAMNAGEGVVLSAIVPVKPEVTIDSYKGLKIKKFEYNVSDADVDKEANKILESQAKNEEVTDRACQNGDTVNIDFVGSVNGEKFPGGTAEDYDLVLGSGAFIPGFEDAVVGMKKGENKDITVKFPDDYQADNLRGKDAVFNITLNKITQKVYPELTDEFVKGHAGVETVAEYKAKTRERLERNAEMRGRDETENSIINEIAKHAKTVIPDAMIEAEIDKMVQDFSYRLMYQGLKLDDYLKYMQLTMEQFRAQFKSQAEPRVLNQLVIDKIIRTEGFKADQKEVDAKIAEQAKSVDKTAEEYKKSMNPRQIDYIANDIVITKMFDFLTANNELYTEGGKPAAKKTAAKPATAEKPAAKKPAAAKTTAAKSTTAKKTTAKKEN